MRSHCYGFRLGRLKLRDSSEYNPVLSVLVVHNVMCGLIGNTEQLKNTSMI